MTPSNSDLIHIHPVIQGYRIARDDHRRPWPKRVPVWHARQTKDLMLARRHEAEIECGKMLGKFLGAEQAFVPAADPRFFDLIQAEQLAIDGRKFEYHQAYRPLGVEGLSSGRDTLVLAELYIAQDQIPAMLARRLKSLEIFDLAIRQLPRNWLLWDHSDATSHVFVIGSSMLL